jgi:hypothetical protein
MKVAVFTGNDEVIVLAIKGRKASMESIDGLRDWFDFGINGPLGRDIHDYGVRLCHIGAGSALQVRFSPRAWSHGNWKEIDDWFPQELGYETHGPDDRSFDS